MNMYNPVFYIKEGTALEFIDYQMIFSGKPTQRKETRRLVIHHSVSPDVSALDIHRWHLNRGWSGNAYHFIIRQNGQIELGRAAEVIGAHTKGFNHDSIGICLTGDFTQYTPADGQMCSLVKLTHYLEDQYGKLELNRHCDLNPTLCPGNLFPWEEFIKQVKEHNEQTPVEDWKQVIMTKAKTAGIITGNHQPDDPAPKWFVLAAGLNMLEKININKEAEQMAIKIPKKMTLQKFIKWIRRNTNCEVRIEHDQVNVVVFANNIEKGKCVPLYAELDNDIVMINELTGNYHSPEDAWEALEDETADTFFPEPFHEWVQDQYLTAGDVTMEKFSV
ncbi:MAG: N-acetylmuramoyl-L-alanine amidase [Bacillota bacterium]|nr:N-acetylmuramoyl-L-alanine amidase [Bacillota bacterium]MEA1960498.1 N-acetylmuramoyl-L-alanine amidase [Bacillota bacterium]